MSEQKPNNGPAVGTTVSWPRLVLALVAAPLILAAFLTLLAYLVAAAGESTRADTMARVTGAAWTFFLYLPLFSVTVGLAGALALLRLGLRTGIVWAATGALLGAAAVTLLGLATGTGPAANHVIVVAVLGFILMSLVRGFAGIRSPEVTPSEVPPEPR